MRGAPLVLASDLLEVTIDPGRGADILSMVHRPSGIDVMFSTPWRARADAIRAGELRPATLDSEAQWMEQYRGGWQTLCPNAGSAREHDGAPFGFHGEASVVPWAVRGLDTSRASLSAELFTVPVWIDRELTVDGDTLVQVDTLVNLSDLDLEFDYSSHPALSGEFLEGECVLETNGSFTPDPESAQDRGDISIVPAGIGSRFGWLSGFEGRARASVTNPRLGLRFALEWDAATLPYAWVWEELEATTRFPWFGRARTMAVEPASTTTSGPGRANSLRLLAGAERRIELRASVSSVASLASVASHAVVQPSPAALPACDQKDPT